MDTATRSEMRLAKIHIDSDFTAPCDTSILYPAAGGNMHRFTALTSCAVLDVLGPPYADSEGRHCTYYNEFPYTRFSGTNFVFNVGSIATLTKTSLNYLMRASFVFSLSMLATASSLLQKLYLVFAASMQDCR